MQYEYEMPEFLSEEYVKKNGILYDDNVFSNEGLWNEILYDKPKDKGGKPFSGLLYFLHSNGKIGYYIFYENGYERGPYATFHSNGNPAMYLVKSERGPIGNTYFWYENGQLKEIINHYDNDWKYTFIKWNEDGKIISQGEVPKGGN